MDDLEFECDAVGCETKIKHEDGLCKYHAVRDIEAKRNGGPRVPRKSADAGIRRENKTGKPSVPLTGPGRTALKGAAELKCGECGITASEAFKTQKKYFSRKKGRCRECLAKEKPLKKKGKAEKTPLTPALSLKGRGRRKTKAAPLAPSTGVGRGRKKTKTSGEQIPPGILLEKEKEGEYDGPELTLDFTGHEKLLAIITAEAQLAFRTPGMQALFMLKEALGE